MKQTGQGRLAIRGVIGTLVIALVVLACMNINRLPLIGNNDIVHVEFAEAGNLKGGDAVMVSGATVGRVREVRLEKDKVVADIVLNDKDLVLGTETEAAIVTMTLLGRAAIQLTPRGEGRVEAGDTIPVTRTSAPYSLTSTLNQLTDTSAAINKEQLAAALAQTSASFEGTADDIGPALNGIRRLADTLTSNDAELTSLLDRADRVTGVLASRDKQIGTLLGSGHSLLAELNARQDVVVDLLRSTRALSRELQGLVSDNRETVPAALTQLDKVITLLNDNRDELQASIVGLRGYATAFGEAISSGPWFDAYIQNLTSPGTLAPVLSGLVP